MTFARNLRQRREAAELTQAELADRASTTQDYVSDLERGEHEPGLDLLRRFAAALKCKPADLL